LADRSRVEAELLFANEAFYRAFQAADSQGMAELWSEVSSVVCLHPGWPPIFGREEVLASWGRIFDNAPVSIECRSARAVALADAGFVVCFEVLPQGALIATNYFVREDGKLRLVHHQAGPAPRLPAQEKKESPPPRPN
jgi:SnoaL-like domain